MIRKIQRCLLTFYSTSGAIAVEKFCRENGCPGRLIPVPREISASCGMAWAVPAEEKERLSELKEKFSEEIEGTYQIEL